MFCGLFGGSRARRNPEPDFSFLEASMRDYHSTAEPAVQYPPPAYMSAGTGRTYTSGAGYGGGSAGAYGRREPTIFDGILVEPWSR
ncbi:hypothetical protein GQ42DRAFT_165468 [Ramicandelaber brevisporus]|nr:hypothetical protein GQ42DRAFT_165468 [Ramicandelaber brevisporus]